MFNFKIDPRTKAVEIAQENTVAQNIAQPNFGITQPDISGDIAIAPRTVTQSSSFDEAMDDLAKKRKEKKERTPAEETKADTVEETKETTDNSNKEEVYESEKVESDLEKAEEPKKKEYNYRAVRRGGM